MINAKGAHPANHITFAIPFYSGIHYLPRALDSVLAQDDPRWVAFVCDDGSVEGVEKLVRSYGDERLEYHKNPHNLGMAGNWNRCLELAQTELINLLHEDDELLPNYASVVREAAARHPTATAFYAHAGIIGEQGEARFSFPDFIKTRFLDPSPGAEIVLSGEPAVRALLKGDFIMCPTLCYRRSRLGSLRFCTDYKFVQDIELTTQILLRGGTIVGCPDVCYRYRRHDANATSQYTRTLYRFEEESAYFDRVHDVALERGWRTCTKRARNKTILKLNLGYVMLEGLLRRDWRLGARAMGMLIRLQRQALSSDPAARA